MSHATETRPVLKAAELAELLGWRTEQSFHANRATLEAAGFPKKLPGINAWSRACVLRWIETNGETHLPAGGAPDPLAAYAAGMLEGRYAQ